jgi:hypothetical protein
LYQFGHVALSIKRGESLFHREEVDFLHSFNSVVDSIMSLFARIHVSLFPWHETKISKACYILTEREIPECKIVYDVRDRCI